MCRNLGIKFISCTHMYTTITFLGKHERESERESGGGGGGGVECDLRFYLQDGPIGQLKSTTKQQQYR